MVCWLVAAAGLGLLELFACAAYHAFPVQLLPWHTEEKPLDAYRPCPQPILS